MREPWTEPLIWQERLEVRLILLAESWHRLWRERVPTFIARHLPIRIKRFVVVTVAGDIWTTAKTIEPDQITYPLMYDYLDKKERD